jgi:broad specificity phosphatase PhoE
MAALSGFFAVGLARALVVASVLRRVHLTARAIASAADHSSELRALVALVG